MKAIFDPFWLVFSVFAGLALFFGRAKTGGKRGQGVACGSPSDSEGLIVVGPELRDFNNLLSSCCGSLDLPHTLAYLGGERSGLSPLYTPG